MRGYPIRHAVSGLFMQLSCFVMLCCAFGCAATSKSIIPKGEHTQCSYSKGLANSGYAGATIYYPCQKEDGPFAATTLTGGFAVFKEQMSWLSEYIVSHGYIVLAMDPVDNLGVNDSWKTAHKAGIGQLIKENETPESPIYGMVKTDKLQIMGFSKGGGGVLLAASDLGDQIASVQALAPFMDGKYDLSGIQSPVICYTSTDDRIVPQVNVLNMYNRIPDSVDKSLAYFYELDHLDWLNSGREPLQNRAGTIIVTWMNIYLNGMPTDRQRIEDADHWFFEYKFHPATPAQEPPK